LNELDHLLDYSSFDDFFICGPEIMIFCVKDFLSAKGFDQKKIHFELFTTPGQTNIAAKKTESAITTGPKTNIVIKLDGRSFEFDVSLNSDVSILDAALNQGADLPFACKGGVCCTCKARLLEGKVEMDVHWGLEEEEIEQGYILTCQSHPLSEKVIVDFDVK
jgi:ring-1,2-phenylacetyl-CoA epoxidase subunit PaaE